MKSEPSPGIPSKGNPSSQPTPCAPGPRSYRPYLGLFLMLVLAASSVIILWHLHRRSQDLYQARANQGGDLTAERAGFRLTLLSTVAAYSLGLLTLAVAAWRLQQAQASLRREQSLLRNLLDHIPDNVYFKDRESRFLRIGKAMARYVGLADPAEAVGKTDFAFFTEEHARPAYEDEQDVIRTGQSMVNKEEKETWADGRVRWVSTSKVPLRDGEGEIIGTLGISRDITDRKIVEEELPGPGTRPNPPAGPRVSFWPI